MPPKLKLMSLTRLTMLPELGTWAGMALPEQPAEALVGDWDSWPVEAGLSADLTCWQLWPQAGIVAD